MFAWIEYRWKSNKNRSCWKQWYINYWSCFPHTIAVLTRIKIIILTYFCSLFHVADLIDYRKITRQHSSNFSSIRSFIPQIILNACDICGNTTWVGRSLILDTIWNCQWHGCKIPWFGIYHVQLSSISVGFHLGFIDEISHSSSLRIILLIWLHNHGFLI